MEREWFFPYMPTLETERLIIRKITMADARDIFEYSRDPLVAKHVLWDAQQSIRDARSYVRYLHRQYHAGDPSSWGIILKENGKLIGTIGYTWINDTYRSAEIGYSLARSCWNCGYATEALKEVLRYSFEEMRLNRVEAQHEVENPASGRVMVKAGMTCEGIARKRIFNKGHYCDMAMYAMLREDKRP